MKLTIPALNELMQKLEAQPNITSTTPGPKCRECGLAFIVTYGRAKKAWMVLHAGGVGRNCPSYSMARRVGIATQEEAITIANEIASRTEP